MGLTARDLVALSGGHTLGHVAELGFTRDPYAFSNSYFEQQRFFEDFADAYRRLSWLGASSG